MSRLINISELTKLLNIDQDKNKKTSNHTLRYCYIQVVESIYVLQTVSNCSLFMPWRSQD